MRCTLIYKQNTKPWTYYCLCQRRGLHHLYFRATTGILFWTRSCSCSVSARSSWPGQWPHSSCCATVTAKRAQGTESWCPGQILPSATSLHLLVLSPCQEDSLQAVWEGQLHSSCVWFAGAVANPAKPLAAYPCSCWCIYSKSCKLKVSMVSAPSLDSGEDQAPLRLTGWPCRGLGACTLGVPPAP